MDVPIIVFVLLFVLVLILIMLHRSNKKFADKISVLEQAVEMKSESLTSMKETYAASVKALSRDELQKKDIEDKKNSITTLEDRKASLEQTVRDKNKNISQLNIEHKKTLKDKDKEKLELQDAHEHVIEEVSQKIVAIENNLIEKEHEVSSLIDKQKKEVDTFKANSSRLEEVISKKSTEIEVFEKNNTKMSKEMKANEAEYQQTIKDKNKEKQELQDAHELVIEEVSQKIVAIENNLIEKEHEVTSLIDKQKKEVDTFKANSSRLEEVISKKSTE
ncbi:MAG: hypothetical protein U9N11_02835, partial [Campylobacterota bacterium]|nr:hypothetical protein [Campylobacterota bacterium]